MDNNTCPNMEVFGVTCTPLPSMLATPVYSSLCFIIQYDVMDWCWKVKCSLVGIQKSLIVYKMFKVW